jgi:hypothetical protein
MTRDLWTVFGVSGISGALGIAVAAPAPVPLGAATLAAILAVFGIYAMDRAGRI